MWVRVPPPLPQFKFKQGTKMELDFIWCKWRHKWRTGETSNWEYVEVAKQDLELYSDLGEYLRDYYDPVHPDDEGYRGMDFEEVELPPKEYFLKKIKESELRIKCLQKEIEMNKMSISVIEERKEEMTKLLDLTKV